MTALHFKQVFEYTHESVPAVEYCSVSKEYAKGVRAVDKVSFSINQGDFVMLVGSSGGGKTTILKMVNGLIEPSEGEVKVYGKSVSSYDIITLRRHIGYAIQGSVLFPHMTVGKNIAYVMNLEGEDRNVVKKRVFELLDMVGLDRTYVKKYPHELSGGEQQRVGIARALANKPRLLLMDEPFGAVDSITRSSLQDELFQIYKETGITIMFVTHDISEAFKLGTNIAVMASGVLQQYDRPDSLLENPATPYVTKLIEDYR